MWDSFVQWFKEWFARWWSTIISILLLIAIVFGLFWWWTGPVYDPGLMTITNVTLNGVPMDDVLTPLVINRQFTLSCTIRSNKERFLSVDSHVDPYGGFILDESVCKRAFAEGKIDPVFTVAFTSLMRAGRNMQGTTAICGVKTNETGETAELTVKARAPRSSGRYSLKFELLTCDRMVKQVNGSRIFKPGKIVWHKPITVLAK